MNLLVFACSIHSEAASLKRLPSFLVFLKWKISLPRQKVNKRTERGLGIYKKASEYTLNHIPNWKLARAISSQRQTLSTFFKMTQEHCGIFTLVNRLKTSQKRRRYASVTCHLTGSFATGLLRKAWQSQKLLLWIQILIQEMQGLQVSGTSSIDSARKMFFHFM